MYASVVFYQIVVMLILAGLGFLYQRAHPLSSQELSSLSRIVAMVLASGVILSGAVQDYSMLSVKECVQAAVVGFATYPLLMLIGYGLGCLFSKERGRRLIYSMLCSYGNVGFFGIPVVYAAYSPEVAIYMYFFIVPCNICSYTLGYMLLNSLHDGSIHLQPRRLLNPGFFSCLAVCIVFLFQINLPSLPREIIDYLTTASTPMAMFIVGVSLYNTKWRQALADWRMILFCLIRQIAIPLLAGLLLKLVLTNEALLGISIIMLSLPVGNATILLADTVGVESAPGPEVISITTLISVFTIPLVLAILL